LFANNTVAYNSSLYEIPTSTAVRMDGPGAEIYNNIIWWNVYGPELTVREDAFLPVEFFNNIIGDGDYDLPPSTSMGGNRDEDPVLGLYPDFHISVLSSPAIDEGQVYTGLPPTDIDGEAREIDGDDDGTAVVDIGADEVGGIVTVIPLRVVIETDKTKPAGSRMGSCWFRIQNSGLEPITIVDTTLENDGPYGAPSHDWFIGQPCTGTVLPPASHTNFKVVFPCSSFADSTNRLIVETSAGTITADLIGDYIPPPSNDIDFDGVYDEKEWGPGQDDDTYDGNCDNVPDYLQENVVSLPLRNDRYVTIAAPHEPIGTGHYYALDVDPLLYDVSYIYTPDESGSGPYYGIEYPYGFIEFKVTTIESISPGSNTYFPVTIILPSDGPRINGYVKHLPARVGGDINFIDPTRPYAVYSDVPDILAGLVGAWYEDVTFINSDPPVDPPPPCVGETHQVIHLMLRDGLLGDVDLTADGKVEDPGGPAIMTFDSDEDGLPDDQDNCPNHHNPGQEDTYPLQGNACGDACECEGNFDGDQDQDGSDAFDFKVDFGRSQLGNPCESGNPCNGDFDCDHDCDGTDAFTFKQDFGRSPFLDPCPNCVTEPWCIYP
jgi:hypothetical protein